MCHMSRALEILFLFACCLRIGWRDDLERILMFHTDDGFLQLFHKPNRIWIDCGLIHFCIILFLVSMLFNPLGLSSIACGYSSPTFTGHRANLGSWRTWWSMAITAWSSSRLPAWPSFQPSRCTMSTPISWWILRACGQRWAWWGVEGKKKSWGNNDIYIYFDNRCRLRWTELEPCKLPQRDSLLVAVWQKKKYLYIWTWVLVKTRVPRWAPKQPVNGYKWMFIPKNHTS